MQKHDILMCENNIYVQLLYFYKDWFWYAAELPAT